MEYENIRINKLKGLENWASWKFQVRVTLKSYDTWEIITGESFLPSSSPLPEMMRQISTYCLDKTR